MSVFIYGFSAMTNATCNLQKLINIRWLYRVCAKNSRNNSENLIKIKHPVHYGSFGFPVKFNDHFIKGTYGLGLTVQALFNVFWKFWRFWCVWQKLIFSRRKKIERCSLRRFILHGISNQTLKTASSYVFWFWRCKAFSNKP